MSRFIDELNRVSEAVLQPIGFRTAQPVSDKPKMQLIASLAQANIEDLARYVAGANAGLLRIPKLSSGAKALQKVSQAVSHIPWGGRLGDSGHEAIKQIVKAGWDFVVFPAANTSLAILQIDEVGKILEVEVSLSEGLLRAVNELPVDAVLIAGEQEREYFLTWHHLMLFRHFADLLSKPLLVSIPSNVTANELQALWEAGVNGVVIKVGVEQPTGRLQELRQAIDKLTFPPPHKRRKVEALLPHIGEETGIVTEEEEE